MDSRAETPGESQEGPLQSSVVVPVLNSAASLEELRDRIQAALESVPRLEEWELILVNDGSEDGSWEQIVRMCRDRPRIRGIDLAGNWGQHNALLAGIKAARYEVIVTLDDDLQHPPEEIPNLLDGITRGLDLVYGMPTARAQPLHRRIGAVAVRAILRVITGRREALSGSGFRAFRARLAEQLPDRGGRRVVLDPALRRATKRVGSVAVRHDPRRTGSSNYSLPMLARFACAQIAADLRLWGRNGRDEPSYAVRVVTDQEPGDDGGR